MTVLALLSTSRLRRKKATSRLATPDGATSIASFIFLLITA
jgi:hypothetical protein